MALTVDDIITKRVRVLLRDIDTGGIQWKDAELIDWLNEACSEIGRYRPEAVSQTVNDPLQAGCEQTIPAGGSLLLEGICNVNPTDGTLGRVIRPVERSVLDNENPNWMFDTPTNEVLRYVPSLTDPRTYYVYPPSDGAATSGLKIVYSAPPTVATALNDPLPLPDMYEATIANYILYRAFGKLRESEQAQAESEKYLQIFNGQVGATDKVMELKNAKNRHEA